MQHFQIQKSENDYIFVLHFVELCAYTILNISNIQTQTNL